MKLEEKNTSGYSISKFGKSRVCLLISDKSAKVDGRNKVYIFPSQMRSALVVVVATFIVLVVVEAAAVVVFVV